jgi:hypothetical protein
MMAGCPLTRVGAYRFVAISTATILPNGEASHGMAHIQLRSVVLVASIFLLHVAPVTAVTVIQPVSRYFNGTYDTMRSRTASLNINLGIEFSNISDVDLRLIGKQQPGIVSDLNDGAPHRFGAMVAATLNHDDGTPSAIGDKILPAKRRFDTEVALDWPSPLDYSPLIDGIGSMEVSFFTPLMVGTSVVHRFPKLTVDAAAVIVTGDAFGELQGDYDRDGVVYRQDYLLWRDTFGTTVEPGTGADGDGDGIVDHGDYTLWRDHFMMSLRPTNGYLAGDFNYNGVVDAADYSVWRTALGTEVAPFSGPDANGNGRVEGNDLKIWRNQFGVKLPEGAGELVSAVPEPSTLLLAALSMSVGICVRRR